MKIRRTPLNSATPPSSCRRRDLRSVLYDWAVIGALAVFLACLEWAIGVHRQCVPQDGGVRCGKAGRDPQLSYPYKWPETIAFGALCAVAAAIWIANHALSVALLKQAAPSFSWRTVFFKSEQLLRVVFFAIAVNQVVSNAVKVYVGRPRPNYYDIVDNHTEKKHESRRSFPSGHTSFVWTAMTLLSLFHFRVIVAVNRRLYQEVSPHHLLVSCHNTNSYFLLPLWKKLESAYLFSVVIAFLPSAFAIFVSVSRIVDYWHHYEDVLCGMLIGVGSAFLSFYLHFNEMFARTPPKKSLRNVTRHITTKDEETPIAELELTDGSASNLHARRVHESQANEM